MTHRQQIVRVYHNRKEAERACNSATAHGWTIESFQVHDLRKGWSCWKTCCLGVIFLPLALFGKKPDESEYIVTFTRATA